METMVVVNVPGYSALPCPGIPRNFFSWFSLLIYKVVTATFNHKITVIYEAWKA